MTNLNDRNMSTLETISNSMNEEKLAGTAPILEMLSAAERRQLLYEWNDTAVEYPSGQCMHELFEAQAEKTPEAIAVVYDGASLSYAELNRRANRLAHYLRKLGVRPESTVAICVERSFEMIVALLAVLKAGGAYVPLDPAYPAERLAFMLEDSAPVALLIQAHLAGLFQSIPEMLPVLDLVDPAAAWNDQPETNPDLASIGLLPNHLAYIIYTSGSTGTPKGVMIEHGAACNTLHDVNAKFSVSSQDRTLGLSSLSFDLSVYDIFGTLAVGGSLVIPQPDRFSDALKWQDLVRKTNVSVWNSAPALMQLFVDSAAQAHAAPFDSIRLVMLSGDWFSVRLSEQIRALCPNASIHSLGGATEVSIWSVTFPVALLEANSKTIPYGKPLGNQSTYLLDDAFQPVPVGVTAELYIGGVGVARGYRNRPELTAERFLPDPFSSASGARMYRTGDLGRWHANGNIEFLGRNDFQVKIRGFRIELGEIEAQLSKYPGVRDAIVIAREDTPGDKRLVAYYTAQTDPDEEFDAETLRAHLSATLPEYMVPAAYVNLESLPLTPNGKVDRKTLPAPKAGDHAKRGPMAAEAPSLVEKEGLVLDAKTPLSQNERDLLRIWQQLFKVEDLDVQSNFFDLGGDSLLLARFQIVVKREFGFQLTTADVFRDPTVAALAVWLDHKRAEAELAKRREANANLSENHRIIPLQPLGAGRPVFVISQSTIFRVFAEQLGDSQPVYALQMLDEDITPAMASVKFEELTNFYVRLIREVQPAGPYRLAGWCVSGWIAYGIARQLEREGEEIELLTVIDAWAPGYWAKHTWLRRTLMVGVFRMQRLRWVSRRLRQSTASQRKAYIRRSLHGMAADAARKLTNWLHRMNLPVYIRLTEEMRLSEQLEYTASRSVEVGALEGRVLLFRSEEQPTGPMLAHDMGWTQLLGRPVRVEQLPGDHQEIFENAGAKIMAAQAREALGLKPSASFGKELPQNSTVREPQAHDIPLMQA